MQCPVKAVQYIDASALDEATFVRDYLRKNIPVVVKGALR